MTSEKIEVKILGNKIGKNTCNSPPFNLFFLTPISLAGKGWSAATHEEQHTVFSDRMRDYWQMLTDGDETYFVQIVSSPRKRTNIHNFLSNCMICWILTFYTQYTIRTQDMEAKKWRWKGRWWNPWFQFLNVTLFSGEFMDFLLFGKYQSTLRSYSQTPEDPDTFTDLQYGALRSSVAHVFRKKGGSSRPKNHPKNTFKGRCCLQAKL